MGLTVWTVARFLFFTTGQAGQTRQRREEETRQDKTRQDKPREYIQTDRQADRQTDRQTGHDKAGQDRTEHSRTGQDMTGQTKQDLSLIHI